MENEKIQMTKEGYNDLKKEYENLVHVARPEVISELTAARAQGDLSENADYDVARDKQAKIEARIAELDTMLQNAQIIEPVRSGSKSVRMGSTVTIKDLSRNETVTYTIVGTVEADPMHGKLSNTTPLGSALLEHRAGDTISVNAVKSYKVKIEKIS